MAKTPIIDALLEYTKEKNAPFSMPGHKGGRGMFEKYSHKNLKNMIIDMDITEVEGLDNLHKAEGIIKESEELLSNLYGSEKSYFLVNGSTSGNLAMIFSAFNEGDKVIVERNCHRSIFNSIVLRKLKPVYVDNIIDDSYNAPVTINMEHFFETLDNNTDAAGVIVTYPNYYGIACDLERIVYACKRLNMMVLVDCAHGAHFGISEMLPENPLKLGADIVVMSAHKTLPSLTQTAFLHVSNRRKIKELDFYVSVFSTTSPSYIFLAAMDYCRAYMEEYGREDFEKCIHMVKKYSKIINAETVFNVMNQEDISRICSPYNVKLDKSRMVINCGKRLDGFKITEYLRKCGVQCEMSDGSNIVLIAAPFNSKEDYDKLVNALKNIEEKRFTCNKIVLKVNRMPTQKLAPYEAVDMESNYVPLGEALGQIAAANIVPYPPGIPIVVMGEVIDKNSLGIINYYVNEGTTILGLDNRKINVLK